MALLSNARVLERGPLLQLWIQVLDDESLPRAGHSDVTDEDFFLFGCGSQLPFGQFVAIGWSLFGTLLDTLFSTLKRLTMSQNGLGNGR